MVIGGKLVRGGSESMDECDISHSFGGDKALDALVDHIGRGGVVRTLTVIVVVVSSVSIRKSLEGCEL